MTPVECDQLIIGGGVIGLAVAARSGTANTLLVETHSGFGRETSSRNSEVIHSGIHYPADAWKTKLCIEGRARLTAFAQAKGLPWQSCGKLTVATVPDERAYLDRLAEHSRHLGVPAEFWNAERVTQAEPSLRVQSALHFPESGILDTHRFMAALERDAQNRGVSFAYRHRVVSVAPGSGGWDLEVESPQGTLRVRAERVVNAAGLGAAALSNLALQTSKYEHRFCRGRYFRLSARYQGRFGRLVYPVPNRDGLGVHLTIDMAGGVRLGPDVDWLPPGPGALAGAYDCDWEAIRETFVNAGKRYCPELAAEDLSPDLIGVRPKLFLDGQAHPDFLMENHRGWVHCLGIESPGWTASLAVADRVAAL